MILHLYLMENMGYMEIAEKCNFQIIKSSKMNQKTQNLKSQPQHNSMDDLETYNADPVHDGQVDFDYNENTGELSDLFEETDIAQYIDNLNDWD